VSEESLIFDEEEILHFAARSLSSSEAKGSERQLFQVFNRAFSVVLETPHPSRPVGWLDVAGFGPGACRVELAMPLQCPQLFEADFWGRPI
jgi:hypothetical protein